MHTNAAVAHSGNTWCRLSQYVSDLYRSWLEEDASDGELLEEDEGPNESGHVAALENLRLLDDIQPSGATG